MKRLQVWIFWSIVIFLLGSGYGQSDKGTIEGQVTAFYETLKSGNVRQALEDITMDTPLYTKIFGDEATTKNFLSQLRSLTDYYGQILGIELVREECLGKLCKFTYFFYHEQYLTRFMFTFYKPQNDWLLVNFEFDDRVLEELE